MAKPLLTDEMWAQIEPLLRELVGGASSQVGRQRLSDRSALTGILFVLKSGVSWEQLPLEMGCGCGMTCLRRLREWQTYGIWDEIREVVVQHCPRARELDWARADIRRKHAATGHPPHRVVAGQDFEG